MRESGSEDSRHGKAKRLSIPTALQRNAPDVMAHGVENTGESLLQRLAQRIGRPDLAGLDLLDIGCGVRFTQTLINRERSPYASALRQQIADQ
jgi:hypothetical protein